MSLRWRLIVGIALVLSLLWAPLAIWYFFDARASIKEVLDTRMASSAWMVLDLIERGDLRLSSPGASATEVAPLHSSALASELTCQLWTMDGRLLAVGNGAPPLQASEVPDGYSNHILNGERWRVYAVTSHDSGLRILTTERRERRIVLMRNVATAVALPVLLIVPAALLLVWLVVRRGLAPLDRLRRLISSRSVDAMEPIADKDVPPEVAPLVDTLNDLLLRLGSALERERRFTGNAAHELRTPLAGIKTQLQIACAADGEVRDRALAQAETGVDRMSRLVAQMLMLARLETQLPIHSETNSCNMAVAVSNALQDLQPIARQRGVRLVSRGVEGKHVPLPLALLYAALRNLVENAVNHSAAGAQVVVEFTAGAEGSELRVIDEGPGLPEDELAQVVNRFYRAGTPDHTGTGLGLSIVTAIAQRYGLRFRLENRGDASGLIARLAFPD